MVYIPLAIMIASVILVVYLIKISFPVECQFCHKKCVKFEKAKPEQKTEIEQYFRRPPPSV